MGAAVMVRCAVLAGLLALLTGFYVRTLRAELETSQEAAKAAGQGISDRDEIIRRLLVKQRRNDQARKALENNRTAIRSTLAARESMIRNLENENAELRAWSAVPLPDAVVRLRQHAPITGAANYRQRVHEGDALQPAGR